MTQITHPFDNPSVSGSNQTQIGTPASQPVSDPTKDPLASLAKAPVPGRARKIVQPAGQLGEFATIGLEVGNLVEEKNKAYGDAFAKAGSFLALLYPNGIQPHQYTDALCQVRIFDKQMRIATDADAFGESPYLDITGYGILGARNHKVRRAVKIPGGSK